MRCDGVSVRWGCSGVGGNQSLFVTEGGGLLSSQRDRRVLMLDSFMLPRSA